MAGMSHSSTPENPWIKVLGYALPFPVILVSLFIGPSDNLTRQALAGYLGGTLPDAYRDLIWSILFDIRLPRITLVFLTGGVLAVSGSALQSVFRNPLVSPYVLGLSSGAAFGAALALWVSVLPVSLSAFAGGLGAVAISYYMARKHKQVSLVSLILAGIVTNGIFTALLTVVQVLSDPFKLQTIVYWTMGNFHNASWDKVYAALGPMLAGIFILFLMRWKLNVLALGDDEASSAGLNPARLKIWILLAATLASSAAVAVAGIIGLYGLIVPHAVRMIYGVDNQRTLLLNLFIGGSFLVVIDDISRTAAGFEIPIGVFTMLVGAPFFIYLLKKSSIGWEQ